MTKSGEKSGARQDGGADTTHNAAGSGARGAGELAPCVTLTDIIAAACEVCGVEKRAVLATGQTAELTLVRHVIWYVALEHFRLTGSAVTRAVFRDVATVYWGRDRILREMRTNERTALLVRSVRKRTEAIATARIAVATADPSLSKIGGSKL